MPRLFLCAIYIFSSCVSISISASHSETKLPVPYQPELLFDISDEMMSFPLGAVTDVKISSNGIVYLLDQQNCNIRRITLSGELKSPIGGRGEGPGEMRLPRYLALFSDGRCLVIQDMTSRIVCLTQNGDACDMGDISIFREGYQHTIVTRAEVDPKQRLILSATTMKRRTRPGASLEDLGTCITVGRAHTKDARLEILFTTDSKTTNRNTIFFPLDWLAYGDYGWDINKDGTIIYFDPKGSYSVNIGHPADGKTIVISLMPWEYDDERIEALAEESGTEIKPNEMLRITRIEWLDSEFFMVQPTAEIHLTPMEDVIGTFEVFRRDGCSFGRYIVQADYDFDDDGLFICGDILVIIKGGKSTARAAFSAVLPLEGSVEEKETEEADTIRILAYRLFHSIRESD